MKKTSHAYKVGLDRGLMGCSEAEPLLDRLRNGEQESKAQEDGWRAGLAIRAAQEVLEEARVDDSDDSNSRAVTVIVAKY